MPPKSHLYSIFIVTHLYSGFISYIVYNSVVVFYSALIWKWGRVLLWNVKKNNPSFICFVILPFKPAFVSTFRPRTWAAMPRSHSLYIYVKLGWSCSPLFTLMIFENRIHVPVLILFFYWLWEGRNKNDNQIQKECSIFDYRKIGPPR